MPGTRTWAIAWYYQLSARISDLPGRAELMIEDSSGNGTEGKMRAICGRCRHYYVTWDRTFPHGCRAMGFKSRMPPALQVKEASGMDCQMFARKDRD